MNKPKETFIKLADGTYQRILTYYNKHTGEYDVQDIYTSKFEALHGYSRQFAKDYKLRDYSRLF